MRQNESGFGFVQTLLVLIVIAAISGAGLYVWQQNQKASLGHQREEKNSTAGEAAANEAGQQDSNTITVEEWGITISPTDKESFQYFIDGDYMYFTSSKLAELSKDCELDSKPHLIRRLSKPSFYNEATDQETHFDDIKRSKKATKDGKYYFVVSWGAPCAYDNEAYRLLDTEGLVESIEPANQAPASSAE